MMVEVTAEDWDAAQIYADLYSGSECYKPSYHLRIGEAFARHRIEAEQRCKLEGARLALEAAAKTARDYAAKAKGRGWMPHADSAPKAAQHIAANIRAVDPATIVKEASDGL